MATMNPRRQFDGSTRYSACHFTCVWLYLDGFKSFFPKTCLWSSSSSHLLSHQCAILLRVSHGLYFNKFDQTLLLSFGIFFYCPKIPRATGGELLKTPQALGLTSKQLSSFFTRCFQDPCLFSPGNEILLEIFLSDITIYRTLALHIMFIFYIQLSHKVYKGVREHFLVCKSFTMASL